MQPNTSALRAARDFTTDTAHAWSSRTASAVGVLSADLHRLGGPCEDVIKAQQAHQIARDPRLLATSQYVIHELGNGDIMPFD